MEIPEAEHEKKLALVADVKHGIISHLENKITETERQITDENRQQVALILQTRRPFSERKLSTVFIKNHFDFDYIISHSR
jgi:hypothetical protein